MDVLPADFAVGAVACPATIWLSAHQPDSHGTAAFALAGEANATEDVAGGEDDAAVLVVPGVVFDLLHHRELHAVDGDQFIEGEAEGLGHQHIDLHQGLAAGVVGSQGAIALPGGGEVAEEAVGQAGIVIGPALLAVAVIPAFAPEIGRGAKSWIPPWCRMP